jgi:hypothetical protein
MAAVYQISSFPTIEMLTELDQGVGQACAVNGVASATHQNVAPCLVDRQLMIWCFASRLHWHSFNCFIVTDSALIGVLVA